MSCPACEAAPPTGELAAASVLLVGNPNVGKSTLFNALTGARQRAVNAPGTTLEIAVGTWNIAGEKVGVADLPGAFSLDARSLEEKAVAEALAEAEHGTVALVVLDATALPRSLYLLAQVADSGRPVIGALTMVDIARDRGSRSILRSSPPPRAFPCLPSIPAGAPASTRSGSPSPRLSRSPITSPHPRRSEGAAEADVERWFAWVETVTNAMPAQAPRRVTATDRIDRVMLHPWVGVPVFLLVMWGLFELSTRVAGPLDLGDRVVRGGSGRRLGELRRSGASEWEAGGSRGS